jgi:nucleoside-diphosphate kinase
MMVKPDAHGNAGEIIDMLASVGLAVKGLRMTKLLRKDAEEFYGEHRGQHFFDKLVTFMSSGPVVAMEVVGKGAIGGVRQLNGPTDSSKARTDAPSSIRARFGRDGTVNAVHGSDSPASAAREIAFFFTEKKGNPTCTLSADSTLCLVKPHALEASGAIWQAIAAAGFTVTAAQTFALDRVSASEFLEVYKGVVPEYVGMVTEFTKGNTLALELSGGGGQPGFRQLCGPRDPEIARHLRPDSLRARFGMNKIQNAVHCTDLPEDGPLELEYFFAILVNSGHH